MQEDTNNKHLPEDDRPPHNKARFAFTIALFLVLVLLIIGIFTPVRTVVINRFTAPTPTATLASGDNLFYIQATPKGTISIDGRTLTNVPDPNSGSAPLQLARGIHTITWQAQPFAPVSCAVSIPSSTNKCSNESVTQSPSGANVRLITFNASFNNLPSAPRNALIHTLQATLNTLQSTTTIQTGEHYLLTSSSGADVATTATQTLKATLHFNLDTNPASNRTCISKDGEICTNNGQNCLQLCTIQVETSPGAQTPTYVWSISALFHTTWTYTTGNGQVLAQNQPDSASNDIGTDHGVPFRVTWDGQSWHASILSLGPGAIVNALPIFVDPICTSLKDLVNGVTAYANPSAAPGAIQWNLFAGINHASGCLGVASPANSTNAPPAQSAYVLYRCGVLVAANPLAHRYFPNLPIADAYEQGLVQSI